MKQPHPALKHVPARLSKRHACFNSLLEGCSHQRDIAGCSDGGIGHDGSGTHFHGFTGLGGAANPGVDDNRQCYLINNDLDKIAGCQPFVGTDRRSQGMIEAAPASRRSRAVLRSGYI